ncbi:hypothetical protein PZ938_05500 [Luteipulveratus sp. YIM 133132]|uniref:hypothetical protein n=1 Tax=Luteipulveratus flavus TaxID=3031728 RepID=UPI0023AEACB5|nr:hypothetical protein [Luteipulveratus sp. YIM 133132]MDE9365056.1 hypothetical protein [Luteipulveratus sp. YIM 133132]
MSNYQGMQWATCRALLDVITGTGVLLQAPHEDDVASVDRLGSSLHEADWDRAMDELRARGFVPLEDEDHCATEAGQTADGWSAFLLIVDNHEDAVRADVDVLDYSEAYAALLAEAGVQPGEDVPGGDAVAEPTA